MSVIVNPYQTWAKMETFTWVELHIYWDIRILRNFQCTKDSN